MDKCKGCKYVIADINAKGPDPYRCVNQGSPNFGEKTGKGCELYERFNPKPDMPFKDALEKLILMDEAYPNYFFKFGKPDESSRPFYWLSFKDNKQMLEWRDAMGVCFQELMRMKKEAGDFDKEDDQ